MHLGFTSWIQFGENAAIFPENVIDVAHEVGGIAVLPVVEGTPAVVRAKPFVLTALKTFTTNEAGLFFHVLF